MPCPPPGDLPDPGIEPASPAFAGRFFATTTPGRCVCVYVYICNIYIMCVYIYICKVHTTEMPPAEAPLSARSGAPGTCTLLYGQQHHPSPERIVFSQCRNAFKVHPCSQELHFGIRSPGDSAERVACGGGLPLVCLPPSLYPH